MVTDIVEGRDAFSFPSCGDYVGVVLDGRGEDMEYFAFDIFLSLVWEEVLNGTEGDIFIFEVNFGDAINDIGINGDGLDKLLFGIGVI